MTHLAWATAFFALYAIGSIAIIPRTTEPTWKSVATAGAAACLICSIISYILFFLLIFGSF